MKFPDSPEATDGAVVGEGSVGGGVLGSPHLPLLCLIHGSSVLSILYIAGVRVRVVFKLFNWRLITLQYCGGFCYILT